MDKKGIRYFLIVVLICSIATEVFCICFRGVYVRYTLLLWPLAAVYVARRKSPPSAEYPAPRVLNVPRIPAIRIAVMVPLLVLLTFVLTTAVGLSDPDWRLTRFMAQLPSAEELNLPPHIAAVYPLLMLSAAFAVTAIAGPTVYACFLLGHEYGWRGYLLPRLTPLGKWRASVIASLLWSLTFVPLFAAANRRPFVSFVVMTALATVIGVLLARIRYQTDHVALTAITAGAIAAQMPGMWHHLFPLTHRVEPFAGAMGVASILVWSVVALFPQLLIGRASTSIPAEDEFPITSPH